MRSTHPALLPLSLALIAFCPLAQCRGDEVDSPEQQAVEALKRYRTNIQFNKDGTTRLVRLSKPAVTDDMLSHLQHFKQLDYLAIVCPQVTDANTMHLAALTNLDTLLLSESGVGDPTLEHLSELKKLERLYLADTKITDDGLRWLAPLTQLRTLSLEKTGISDEGLPSLRPLVNLESLWLSETSIRGDGLAVLEQMPKLRVLHLDQCKLVARGLKQLQAVESLEHISLNRVPLDQKAVAMLAGLHNTKVMELYGTGITHDQWAQLHAALPNTQLFVDPGLERPSETMPAADVAPTATKQPSEVRPSAELASIVDRLDDPDLVPDFQRHVVPLLGRLGCNGRACHGSFQGQGGFRLSMFGYDFAADHENLAERIDVDHPAESLILNKPTSAEEHEGGARLPAGGWQQLLLQRWITAGGRGVPDNSPRFVAFDVAPKEILFGSAGETTALKAEAIWSDGTREDVTALTRFESNDDSIAEVSADGIVTAVGKGDTYVISLYDNGVFSTQVMLPVSKAPVTHATVDTSTEIDRHVTTKLAKLGIEPAPVCSDEEFLRRVGLDLIGTLPTPAQIEAFQADTDADKRAKKIDQLLGSRAYVEWWTQRLCDLTGSNAGYLGATDMAQPVAAQWREWIRRRVQQNVGWDEIAKGILLATSRRPGQPYREFIAEQSRFTSKDNPADYAAPGNPMPHFWYRDNISRPTDKALAFGYTFMGVRLDCAQCHKHPYDQWSKRDFELFTQFFTRIKTGVAPDAAALREEMREMLAVPDKLDTAALRRQSYLRIAAEGRSIPWNEIWIEPAGEQAQPAKLLGASEIDLAQLPDPRRPLVEWLLSEPNHYFATALVNRIWSNYFHVGIIDPPDDLNLANPPSNKALLNWLVDGFIASGYDLQWLHRSITNSNTYQRSWQTNDTNRTDHRNFSHAVFRRLPAEVAVDAIIQATASDKSLQSPMTEKQIERRKISQHPKSYQTRSIDYSLLIFGKPLRTTNCDCERGNQPTLLQSLYVRNDREMLEQISRADGWIAEIVKRNPPPEQTDTLIQQAYLRTVSRQPTERELSDCRQYVTQAESLDQGLGDLMWALLNTQEFITNH